MRGSFIFRSAYVGLAALGAPIHAAETPQTIIVTAPGNDLDLDDAISIDATDLARTGTPDLLGTLARDVAGLSLSEAQGNPSQPNLVYRGFVASPLQGNSQGLAVYLDGTRFNLPFGDTVNFDLLPESAIRTLSIRDASAVYGLNALGGAVIIETRTGRNSPGGSLALSAGDHGRREVNLEAGWSEGAFSAFVAGEAQHEDGWRDHSPSTLYNGFVDLGWDGEDAGLHLKLGTADTDLTGNGSSPVELLAAAPAAVFTYPDNTRNRYWRASLHPWIALGPNSRLEASLAWQSLRQRTVNGDLADIEACDEDDVLLCLDDTGDESAVLRDADGAPIATRPGVPAYGMLNRSDTRGDAGSALVQFVDRRPLLGGQNELTLGVSQDWGVTRFAASSELGTLQPDRQVTGLGPIIAQDDGAITPVSLRALSSYTGLFLSDRLPLGPKLTAEIGLRWNAAVIRLDDRLGTALNGRHRFQRFNPGIELDYAVTDHLSLRAGYSEANRTPTPAELGCADADAPCSFTNFFVGDPPLAQVVAHSWEAGASGRISGAWKGQWLLSAWRTTNDDDIQFAASDTRGRAFFRNIGKTRRQGIEASMMLAQGPWTVRLGYAFTDATYRTPLTLSSPDNPAADENGEISVRTGDRLPSIPRHRAIASADYAGKGFRLGADLQAQSGVYLQGDEGNDQPRTDGFLIAGLHGAVTLAGPFELFGSITNLFDARYASFGTFAETDEIDLAEAPGASDPRSLSPGAPRRWRLGLRARF